MALIKSISGIRGTIGGKAGECLSSVDIVKLTAAYGTWALKHSNANKKIIVGRDARISGELIKNIVTNTLISLGLNVIDLGLATTPTTEMAVTMEQALGGIIITASHNPRNWNALKLLNNKGEFLSDIDGKEILTTAEKEDYIFADVDNLGRIINDLSFTQKHIDEIINLDTVDSNAIKKADFSIVIDCVNSVGGIAIPLLLKKLGVKKIHQMYCEPTGEFPHNPEPLPENIKEISKIVVDNQADLGFVVDPDVDRLAIVCENGTPFGEEYTLVAVADYILQKEKGNTVSNLSSSQALSDITQIYNQTYHYSAVGEVNVVNKMKKTKAVIGGEGNGGIIYPKLHYGRDSLVGIALFLSYIAQSKIKCSELRKKYPNYFISKNKITLSRNTNMEIIFTKLKTKYTNQNQINIDGLKIEFNDEWVLIRTSNTEPIMRIYAESKSQESADKLAQTIINDIKLLTITP